MCLSSLSLEYKYMGSCCVKSRVCEGRIGTEGTEGSGRKKPTLVRSEIPKLENMRQIGGSNNKYSNINVKNNRLVRQN